MLFYVYFLIYPFAILLIAQPLKKLSKKRSFIKRLIIAALILQFLPLPRNPVPYIVGATGWWNDIFALSKGEPWAIGVGLPASFAKIYLGDTVCVVKYSDILTPCPEKDRNSLPLRDKYKPGKFETLEEPFSHMGLPFNWFNFVYSIITIGILLIPKGVKALVKRATKPRVQ